jgi:hypothetical protein
MANFYKNAFYDPTVTTAVTTYTCPSNANAIIQNVQVTNSGGSKTFKVHITDNSAQQVLLLHMQVLQDQPFVMLQKDH